MEIAIGYSPVAKQGHALVLWYNEKSGSRGTRRADVYRWADKWNAPPEPVNLFLGPPYREFQDHLDAITWMIATLQEKGAAGSVLTVQSDEMFDPAVLPDAGNWDVRHYGRTQLGVWVKGPPA